MKRILSLFIYALLLPLSAQVADKSVTDCNGNTNSIYAVLNSGKVLVVTSSGLDCSICMSAAPAIQTYAAQNSANIEVWGAMTYKSSNNTNTPSCGEVNGWVNAYNWNDVYAFVDSDRHWFMSATPRYIVYDPSDLSIAYSGPSRSQAFQTATALASTISVSVSDLSDLEIVNFEGGIEVLNLNEPASYRLISLTGKMVDEGQIEAGNNSIMTSSFRPGIYLLSVETSAGSRVTRKIFVN